MDRFSAYLLVRRHLRRPDSRNQALTVEAVMEQIASHLDQVPHRWGVLGLLSQLDLEYSEQNPGTRGVTARQQAELEGLDPSEAIHLERWCRHLRQAPGPRAADALAPVELGLLLSTILAEHLQPGGSKRSLAHDLELMRGRGDTEGNHLDLTLDQLGIEVEAAAEIMLEALNRIAQDLR